MFKTIARMFSAGKSARLAQVGARGGIFAKIMFAAAWLMFAVPAKAQLNVTISGAQQAPIPIAFPQIISDNQGIGAFLGFSYANEVRDVVLADLERSGLFRLINERSYIQEFSDIEQLPVFGDWRVLNAQVLVQSAILEEQGDELKLRFKLWDIISEKELLYEVYTSNKSGWRRLAHSMADATLKPARQTPRADGSGRGRARLFDQRRQSGADAAFFAGYEIYRLSFLHQQQAARLSL